MEPSVAPVRPASRAKRETIAHCAPDGTALRGRGIGKGARQPPLEPPGLQAGQALLVALPPASLPPPPEAAALRGRGIGKGARQPPLRPPGLQGRPGPFATSSPTVNRRTWFTGPDPRAPSSGPDPRGYFANDSRGRSRNPAPRRGPG
jgi:hypothetical protein